MSTDITLIETTKFAKMMERVRSLEEVAKKHKSDLKKMRAEREVLENDLIKAEMEVNKKSREVMRLQKEIEELEAKFAGFIKNQEKGKAGNLVKRKRLARGKFREIIRQNCEDKSIREIHKMCVREGFTGTYETMRLSVLDFEIEQFMNEGMSSLQIKEELKRRRPKTKVETKTIEEMMKNLRLRRKL